MQPRHPELHRFFHKKERAVDYLAARVKELHASIAQSDPWEIARRVGAKCHEGADKTWVFRLSLWKRPVEVRFADFTGRYLDTGEQLDIFSLALLAYYFTTAGGSSIPGRWIAFSDLPDGMFYAQAFQGYTGNELAQVFGNDVGGFERAALRLGGTPEDFADRTFTFEVLPHVSLMVACWLGDEDFPPSYRILFDSAASNHLTTDACAVVGGTITRRLVRAHYGE